MNTPYYISTDNGLVPVGHYLDQKQAEVEIMKQQLLKSADIFGPHYINSMPEDLKEKVYDVLGVNKYLKEKTNANDHIDAMRYALERHKQTVFPDSFYATEPVDKSGWKIVSPSMTYLKAAEKLCEGLGIGLQLGKEEKTGMNMHVGAIIKSTVRSGEPLWVVYRIEKVPANTSEDGYIWVAEAKENDRLRNLMMRCTTYEIQEQFNNVNHTRVRLIYHINSDGSACIPGVEFATVDDIANHDGKAKFKTFTEEIKMAEYSRDVFAGCNFHDGKLYFLPRGAANATYIGRTTGMTVDYRTGECPTGEVNFIIDHEGPKIKIGPDDQKTNYDMIRDMVNNSPVQKYKPDGSTEEKEVWCGSISERYSVEERMLFIIFDGLNKSVKICRSGWDSRPYKMCMYRDKGLLVANVTFETWNDLETQAMYLIHQYLHISFGPGKIGGTGKLTEAIHDARRVVKMIGDTQQQTPESAVAIEEVIFNDPATIVKWADGTKTVVKAHDEPFDKEKGFAMAICKKVLGNKHDYFNTFKKFLKDKKK